MLALTADDALAAFLSQAKELAEIRDRGGKVVGFFAPVTLPHAQHYANAAAHIDPQKVKQTKEAGNKTFGTAEVLETLKSLERP